MRGCLEWYKLSTRGLGGLYSHGQRPQMLLHHGQTNTQIFIHMYTHACMHTHTHRSIHPPLSLAILSRVGLWAARYCSGLEPFCMEFLCCLHVCVGFLRELWFLPTVKNSSVRLFHCVAAPETCSGCD